MQVYPDPARKAEPSTEPHGALKPFAYSPLQTTSRSYDHQPHTSLETLSAEARNLSTTEDAHGGSRNLVGDFSRPVRALSKLLTHLDDGSSGSPLHVLFDVRGPCRKRLVKITPVEGMIVSGESLIGAQPGRARGANLFTIAFQIWIMPSISRSNEARGRP